MPRPPRPPALQHLLVSLDCAESLHKVGFPQKDTCFYWSKANNRRGYSRFRVYCKASLKVLARRTNPRTGRTTYAAPTLSELISQIPVEDRSAGVPADLLHDPDAWSDYYCELAKNDFTRP